MKHIYLICYDVADPKRLRKVYKTLQGAGESLQYSVFRCELSREERQKLIELLWEILNLAEDRLLVANLGLSESRGIDCLQYWGDPREVPKFNKADCTVSFFAVLTFRAVTWRHPPRHLSQS